MTAPTTEWTLPTLPAIGQGTWEMEYDDRPEYALQRGIDLGLTHIDTAEMYGSGDVESIVGRALLGRRDEVFLVSKVLPYNASRKGTIAACEASLTRLQTDRLDCYLLHWPGSEPLEETIAAFHDLKAAGKIRHYGVSNFDVPDLEEFRSLDGADNLACNQVLYHPGERAIERAVVPWCDNYGVPVVAYSPFGHGPLPASTTPVGAALAAVAEDLGVTAHQVALAFVTRRPGMLTIPKASQIAHVEDNARALQLRLSDSHVQQLENALPASRARGLPML